jgi:hypothetical protein
VSKAHLVTGNHSTAICAVEIDFRPRAMTETIPTARIANLDKSMLTIHIEVDPMILFLILSIIRNHLR